MYLYLYHNKVADHFFSNVIGIFLNQFQYHVTGGRKVRIEIFQFACRREFHLNYNESRVGKGGGRRAVRAGGGQGKCNY